jgi:hypothetical protein
VAHKQNKMIKRPKKKKDAVVHFRINSDDLQIIQNNAAEWFMSVGSYLTFQGIHQGGHPLQLKK